MGEAEESRMNKEKTAVADRIVPCHVFERPGPQNTRRTLLVAAASAEEMGVRQVAVASSSGKTGLLAAPLFKGRKLVIVTHSSGFLRPDFQELDPARLKRLEALGARVLTCQHSFGGVNRAVRKKLGTYELDEVIAHTLRAFGEGTKVAIEISLMAADAGLVSTVEPCIAVGGSGEGADTAVLLRPANAQTFFDLRVIAILAKPRLDR
jgi:hypothetical protein